MLRKLLLPVLLIGVLCMMDLTKSSDSAADLVNSLRSREERNNTLYFLRDSPKDARAVLPTLVQLLLEAEETTDFEHLACSLAAAGSAALPQLIEASSHRLPRVRRCAIHAIKKLGSEAPSALPALVSRLTDDDPAIRLDTVEAIASIGPQADGAVPALLQFLQHGEYAQNHAAMAYALQCIGPGAKEAVPILVSIINDDKASRVSFLRYYCLYALGAIGSAAKDAAPALVAVLKQDNDPNSPADLELEKVAALRALGSIRCDDEQVINALGPLLCDANAAVRLACASVLCQLDVGNRTALQTLIAGLSSDDPSHRGDAALSLGVLGPQASEAVTALKKLLEDTEEDNRLFAQEALRKIVGR